ncbi:hypothetical protein ACQQ6W_18745 [Lysinibacillus fusiformis]
MDIFKDLENKMYEANLIDDKNLKKLKFESVNSLYKELKKEKKCIFPNCKSRSIKKSHTIQKSGSLNVIAENSHLLHPYFDDFADEMTFIMKQIGIGEASTFPGFCKQHESIFSVFEEKKDIDTISEGVLQAYRSLCRELVIRKIELKNSQKAVLKYKSERNRQAKLLVESKIHQELRNVEIEHDNFRIKAANIVKIKLTEKITFLEKMHENFIDAIDNNGINNIFLQALKVDFSFPVAIAGLGYLNILEKNDERQVVCLLNVIPFETSTVLILAGELHNEDILMEQFKKLNNNPFHILNFIESFMMHGTDEWYIKPSIWNEMVQGKQDYLLKYLFTTKKAFIEPLEFSIFDDVRKEFLDKFPVDDKFKSQELKKLDFKFETINTTLFDSILERYDDFYSSKTE